MDASVTGAPGAVLTIRLITYRLTTYLRARGEFERAVRIAKKSLRTGRRLNAL
jgi:hypothetical protein